MNSQQFVNQMMSFQAEGGFIIPKEQQSPWWRSYGSKREDAFQMATQKYLDNRENNFVPKPGELKELYKNSVTEIDRDINTQKPPQSTTPTIPMEEVKKIQGTLNYDVWPRVVQRAHNLCKRWQGKTAGYDEYGRVSGGSDFGTHTGIVDDGIRAQYGDPKEVVENEAVIQSAKYKGVVVPPAVKARRAV